jgi:hypothetical protein
MQRSREHGLAHTGRTFEQDRKLAGCGDQHRARGNRLTANNSKFKQHTIASFR